MVSLSDNSFIVGYLDVGSGTTSCSLLTSEKHFAMAFSVFNENIVFDEIAIASSLF